MAGIILPPRSRFIKPPLGVPANMAHPIARGLLGYWPMGEGAGLNIYDATGQNGPGVLTAASVQTPIWKSAGKFGPYIDNNFGNSSYVALPTSVGSTLGANLPCSFSVWANFNAFTSSNFAALISANSTTKGMGIFNESTSGPTFVSDDISHIKIPAASITVGQWVHLVGTWDGNGSRVLNVNTFMYLNGVSAGVTNTDTTYTVNPKCTLGLGGGVNYFNGLYDNAAIWNRVLTPDEVMQLYLQPFVLLRQSKLILPQSSSSAPITIAGTGGAISEFAISEAPISGAMGVGMEGHLIVTEAPDTMAASAKETFTGTLAVTEALDVMAASAKETFTGTLAVTEALDVMAASGTLNSLNTTGTLVVTEAPDMMAAAATIANPVSATLAVVARSDSMSAKASVPVKNTDNSIGKFHWPAVKNRKRERPYEKDWAVIEERERQEFRQFIRDKLVPPKKVVPSIVSSEAAPAEGDNRKKTDMIANSFTTVVSDKKMPSAAVVDHHELQLLLLLAA